MNSTDELESKDSAKIGKNNEDGHAVNPDLSENITEREKKVDSTEDISQHDVGLSKRAKKKLLKRQQWLDTKQERRAKEKEKRKKKMEALKNLKSFDVSRSTSRKILKQKKMSESNCKVGVVFDMQFSDLMTQRDLGKCLKQIMKCYSFNRRLENQLQLYMTSFEGVVKTELSKNDGYENWDFNFDDRRYDQICGKENIVYLTSDSENVVTALENDKYYIIGGLGKEAFWY